MVEGESDHARRPGHIREDLIPKKTDGPTEHPGPL